MYRWPGAAQRLCGKSNELGGFLYLLPCYQEERRILSHSGPARLKQVVFPFPFPFRVSSSGGSSSGTSTGSGCEGAPLPQWLACVCTLLGRGMGGGDTTRILAHKAILGGRRNWEKRCFVPTQQAAYLGQVLDSVAMKAFLAEHNREHPPASFPLQGR